jgi:hypothetical protein
VGERREPFGVPSILLAIGRLSVAGGFSAAASARGLVVGELGLWSSIADGLVAAYMERRGQ